LYEESCFLITHLCQNDSKQAGQSQTEAVATGGNRWQQLSACPFVLQFFLTFSAPLRLALLFFALKAF
jgi:hypothetical protein